MMPSQVYKIDMPNRACDFLVAAGHFANDEVDGITILQLCRYADTIESTFKNVKHGNKWTLESLGQGAYNAKRFETANIIAHGKYTDIEMYERLLSFYKDTQNITLSIGMTLWEAYVEFYQEQANTNIVPWVRDLGNRHLCEAENVARSWDARS